MHFSSHTESPHNLKYSVLFENAVNILLSKYVESTEERNKDFLLLNRLQTLGESLLGQSFGLDCIDQYIQGYHDVFNGDCHVEMVEASILFNTASL